MNREYIVYLTLFKSSHPTQRTTWQLKHAVMCLPRAQKSPWISRYHVTRSRRRNRARRCGQSAVCTSSGGDESWRAIGSGGALSTNPDATTRDSMHGRLSPRVDRSPLITWPAPLYSGVGHIWQWPTSLATWVTWRSFYVRRSVRLPIGNL